MGLTLPKAGGMGKARQGIIHDEWEKMGGKETAGKCTVKGWPGSGRGEQSKAGVKKQTQQVKGRESAEL